MTQSPFFSTLLTVRNWCVVAYTCTDLKQGDLASAASHKAENHRRRQPLRLDAAELIDNPANAVPGYSLYGTVRNDTYFIAIEATAATDPVIGAGTTIWLNTDQNTATGYSPFGSIGAEYNITYDANPVPSTFTPARRHRTSSAPRRSPSALSPDGKSLEIAIPRSLLTPAGGTAPTNINVAGWINNPASPSYRSLTSGRLHQPGIHDHRSRDPAGEDGHTPGRHRLLGHERQPSIFSSDRLFRSVHGGAEPGADGRRLL